MTNSPLPLRACALLVALAAASAPALSQTYTVTGTVVDSETGEALVGATVAATVPGRGTSADRSGRFELDLAESPTTLRVSFVGYEAGAVEVERDAAPVVVRLRPASPTLGAVTVEGAPETAVEAVRSGTSRVTAADVRETPQVLGEPDALKTLQLLPGVRGGREGRAGLHVRGSGPGQNLVLLDGLPLYGTTHLFGFVSAFPTEALDDVSVSRGAFPARYAGRLASVVDLRTRPGARRAGVQASVGLLSSQVVAEGPLPAGASVLFAGRRTYVDAVTRLLDRSSGFSLHPSFSDGYARLDVPAGPLGTLTASAYAGRDAFAFSDDGYNKREEAEIGWSNALGSVRLQGASRAGRYEAGVGAVSYDVGTRQEVVRVDPDGADGAERFAVDYGSRAEDTRAWAQGSVYLGGGLGTVEAGLSVARHRYAPAASRVSSTGALGVDSTSSGDRSSAVSGGAFAEYDVEVGPVRAAAGVHVGYYGTDGVSDLSVQPRLAARYRLSDALALKGSYARTVQPLHLLTNGALGPPTELWLPATDLAPPARADQWTLGAAYAPGGATWALTGDLYYKRERGLVDYLDGASFADASAARWEDVVDVGDGRSAGLEVLLERRRGRLTGWLGYTLSRSTRRFGAVNGGAAFPSPSDRTHDLSVVGRYRLSPSVSLHGSWVVTTGQAATLPVGDAYYCWGGTAGLVDDCAVYTEYGPRNAARLPAYHRLDVAARFGRPDGRFAWTVGLTNAYNAKNPSYVTPNPGGSSSLFGRSFDERYLRGYTLFPLLPFARAEVRF